MSTTKTKCYFQNIGNAVVLFVCRVLEEVFLICICFEQTNGKMYVYVATASFTPDYSLRLPKQGPQT